MQAVLLYDTNFKKMLNSPFHMYPLRFLSQILLQRSSQTIRKKTLITSAYYCLTNNKKKVIRLGMKCLQERVQAKDPPSHYLAKLRTYLDPKASRSHRVRCFIFYFSLLFYRFLFLYYFYFLFV